MRGNLLHAAACASLSLLFWSGPAIAHEATRPLAPPVALPPPVALTLPGLASAMPPPPPPPGLETARPQIAEWVWIAGAVACIGLGVAIDLGAGSSSNGSWDPLDFAPLALYGVGGALAYKGVF